MSTLDSPTIRRVRPGGAILLLFAIGACHSTPRPASMTLRYDIKLSATPRLVLDVSARFRSTRNDFQQLTLPEPTARRFVRDLRAPGGVTGDERGWTTDRPSGSIDLTYRIDLEDMAAELRDSKVANMAGSAVYASWTSWLIRPREAAADALVTLHSSASPGLDCLLAGATDGMLEARARDLRHRVYGAFGAVESDTLAIATHPAIGEPGQVTVVRPRGSFSLGMDETLAFVARDANLLAGFGGGFPASRVLVLLMPVREHNGLIFGRVQPSPFPAVCLYAGEQTGPAALTDDWILLHELIHLTFPPVAKAGRWLDEGLATYFEPILRSRAGARSEEALWTELVDGFRRGLGALEHRGLDGAEGIDDVYWGGALFCLLADVEARQASAGRWGLEDGIRTLVATGYGVTGPLRTLDELIPVLEVGAHSEGLSALWQRHVVAAGGVGLDDLLRRLGVHARNGEVTLDDSAPWAAIRRSIVRGTPTIELPAVALR